MKKPAVSFTVTAGFFYEYWLLLFVNYGSCRSAAACRVLKESAAIIRLQAAVHEQCAGLLRQEAANRHGRTDGHGFFLDAATIKVVRRTAFDGVRNGLAAGVLRIHIDID